MFIDPLYEYEQNCNYVSIFILSKIKKIRLSVQIEKSNIIINLWPQDLSSMLANKNRILYMYKK